MSLLWSCGGGGDDTSNPKASPEPDAGVMAEEVGPDVSDPGCEADIMCTAPGTLCLEGVCVEARCRPDGIACRNNTRVQCSKDGQSQVPVEMCAPGTQCRGGVCVVRACEPDTVICQGTTRQVCNTDGTGYQTQPCLGERICFNGACVEPMCAGEEVACLDDLTLGTCDAGVFRGRLCGFAQRCEEASCMAFHALELAPGAALTAPVPRPEAGSVGLWLALDEVSDAPEVELLTWTHLEGEGLRVTFGAGVVWVSGLLGEPARRGFAVDLGGGDVTHLEIAWSGAWLGVFWNGRLVGEEAVEGWPQPSEADLLRVGGDGWSGRVGAMGFAATTRAAELFVPHCDLGDEGGEQGWRMEEGEGDEAAGFGGAPALQLEGATWTGGLLGRYARDADDDGFGFDPEAILACRPRLEDEILSLGDCNDGNGVVYPEAPELEDMIDNDCDDLIDEQ